MVLIYEYIQKIRLYGASASGALFKHLMTNPIYTKVIENNVDMDKSFGNSKMNIEKVLKEPRTAMIHRHSFLSNLEEYECKVTKER